MLINTVNGMAGRYIKEETGTGEVAPCYTNDVKKKSFIDQSRTLLTDTDGFNGLTTS